MDAKTSAMLEGIRHQIANGPADQVITTPSGDRMRVRRSPEPGVAAIIESLETHDKVVSTSWDACPTPPRGYPEDIPFFAGRPACLSAAGGNRNLQWYGATAADADRLALALLGTGWTETTLPAPSMPGMVIRPFRRGDRQRVVILGGTMLSLVDTPAE